MIKTLVTDELWAVVEPLLPPETPKPKGGRLRIEAREAARSQGLRLPTLPGGIALAGD
jgi:transposase